MFKMVAAFTKHLHDHTTLPAAAAAAAATTTPPSSQSAAAVVEGGVNPSLIPPSFSSSSNSCKNPSPPPPPPFIVCDETQNQLSLIKDSKIQGICVWDVETTGKTTGSNVDFIVSIGSIGWNITEGKLSEFYSLVKPERYITSFATKVHGISGSTVLERKPSS